MLVASTFYKSGPLQHGLSNAYSVVATADDRRPLHQTLVSKETHGRASVAAGYNTLSNVHIIEELIQLPIGSDTVVIAKFYWTKDLTQHFFLEHSPDSCIRA